MDQLTFRVGADTLKGQEAMEKLIAKIQREDTDEIFLIIDDVLARYREEGLRLLIKLCKKRLEK